MRKHIQGIDHVVFAVRDLDFARDTFARMGFTVTPRGFHSLGSQNHCVMFAETYLELLWLPPELKTRPFIADFLARGGDGLAAVALKTRDARKAHAELQAAGLDPTEPVDFSRPVELPEGIRDANFRTLDIGPAHVPCGRLFLCQHLTPEAVWRSEWQRHANGAAALAAMAVISADIAATTSGYERIFDTNARDIAEGRLIETGTASIAVASGKSLSSRLPGVWIAARPAPLIAALFVRVADRALADKHLRRGGFHPVRMPDGSLALGAAEAHGVAMVFG
ncbi:MAG: VOC family protein [Betaproteobacteria bacterium]|nr:VOC family protein [Betaproteobacteria bacterium]